MNTVRKIDESVITRLLEEVTEDFGVFLAIGSKDITSMSLAVKVLDSGKKVMGPGEDLAYHPIHGYNLIGGMEGFPQDAAKIILEHHERSDGSGYPYGLKDKEISKLSKIVAVCDEYLKIRTTSTKEETKEILSSMKGVLNEKILNQFLLFLMDYKEPVILNILN